MLNRLSTFSSKFFRTAFPWTLMFIVVTELVFANNLHRKFFSHEVDKLLYDVDHQEFNSQVVLLGDSVGHQLTTKWQPKPWRYAALASNQAIEMFGQHCLLVRYLKNNTAPHAVMFTGMSPFGMNLDRPLVENYVQRCFTEWDEIYAMTVTKRSPAFSAKAALYRILPSYKYRLHLQENIAGFTNAGIYTGLNTARHNRIPKYRYRLFDVLEEYLEDRRPMAISDEYFLKIIELCEKREIYFYYLPAPMRERRFKKTREKVSELHQRLQKLSDEHPYFIFLAEEFRVYPDSLFQDEVHLNKEGKKIAHDDTLKIFTDIVLKDRPEYREHSTTQPPR